MPALLKLGSVGPDVATWKGLLASAGYPAGDGEVFDQLAFDQTVAWQKAKGLDPDGKVGPQSWGAMTGTKVVAGKTDKYAQFGRDVFLAVWPRILEAAAANDHPEVRVLAAQGGPNLATLQILGGQARLESNYGHFPYTNKTIPEGQPGHSSGVIWNWGAVQAHGDQPGFMASDTHADGTPYTALYRIYPTPEDGAYDMIREMTIRRPASWQKMIEGDIDGWAAQMRSKDPVTGVGLYFEQSVEGRASTVDKFVHDIAFTLNEPIAAVRGGPSPDPTGAAGGASSPDESGPGDPTSRILIGLPFIGAAFAIGWRIFRGAWPW